MKIPAMRRSGYVPGPPEDDPLFRCLKGEMKQRLTDAIEELPEKERLVLTLYYYEELTMKEIGLTLGVVESRVSQIHSSAVVRLRSALRARCGQERDGASAEDAARPLVVGAKRWRRYLGRKRSMRCSRRRGREVEEDSARNLPGRTRGRGCGEL